MKLKVLWTLLEESESLGPVYCALLVQAAEYRRSGGAPAEMLRRRGREILYLDHNLQSGGGRFRCRPEAAEMDSPGLISAASPQPSAEGD